eukprot:CAMPEP_0204581288 /NCGR_PEP_ID=MMETSP0661-20131031/44556_1 /ASSEMBLY_ACC=CAM_ASM_000606 /TAXON_ID=109239 /ORGANISM="Alexandrium margalefi, Strain AMGDE01CS-322" /LENGTH=88 /DNA_ID=CAMNT_0051590457 /DNA_START=11 /DNA_END=274 /DNA_ORIENTATION=-
MALQGLGMRRTASDGQQTQNGEALREKKHRAYFGRARARRAPRKAHLESRGKGKRAPHLVSAAVPEGVLLNRSLKTAEAGEAEGNASG